MFYSHCIDFKRTNISLCECSTRLKMTMQSNKPVHQAEPETPERKLSAHRSNTSLEKAESISFECVSVCEREREERWAWVTWAWACTQVTGRFNQVYNFQTGEVNVTVAADASLWSSRPAVTSILPLQAFAHKNYVLQGLNVYNKRSLPRSPLLTGDSCSSYKNVWKSTSLRGLLKKTMCSSLNRVTG